MQAHHRRVQHLMREQIAMINQGKPDLRDEFVTLNIET